MRMIVRRDRKPSSRNDDLEGDEDEAVKWVNDGSNSLDARSEAAAAA